MDLILQNNQNQVRYYLFIRSIIINIIIEQFPTTLVLISQILNDEIFHRNCWPQKINNRFYCLHFIGISCQEKYVDLFME